MWQTLFHLSDSILQLALIAWVLFSVGLIGWLVKRQGWNEDTRSYLPVLLVIGFVIAVVLPRIGGADGLPIRGYGVMLLLATVSGVALAVHEAKRVGLHPDVIFSLAFWMFIAGISGARIFFLALNWEDFSNKGSFVQTLIAIVNVTQGGLVVYGSLIGGLLAAIIFLRKHKLPILAIGDLIAPSMLVGLCLGRLGCLANGCCFGGMCSPDDIGIQFPPGSPPYMRHVETGQLWGIRSKTSQTSSDSAEGNVSARPDSSVRVATSIQDAQWAARLGIAEGDKFSVAPRVSVEEMKRLIANKQEAPVVTISVHSQNRNVTLMASDMPISSAEVQPVQIYSSINAALFALFLWAYYPFRRRDGETMALLLTIYPLMRFVLEIIRSDEPGRFGTALTISQMVSMGLVVIAFGLWIYLRTQPAGLALPASEKAASPDPVTV